MKVLRPYIEEISTWTPWRWSSTLCYRLPSPLEQLVSTINPVVVSVLPWTQTTTSPGWRCRERDKDFVVGSSLVPWTLISFPLLVLRTVVTKRFQRLRKRSPEDVSGLLVSFQRGTLFCLIFYYCLLPSFSSSLVSGRRVVNRIHPLYYEEVVNSYTTIVHPGLKRKF